MPVVELNGGGAIYTATLSTLTSVPESMLARMFNGAIDSSRDAAGRVFIDRDGAAFATILKWLRGGCAFKLPAHIASNEDYLYTLEQEADFYQFTALKEIASHAMSVYRPQQEVAEYKCIHSYHDPHTRQNVDIETVMNSLTGSWRLQHVFRDPLCINAQRTSER
jgi:BTB/POZ domain